MHDARRHISCAYLACKARNSRVTEPMERKAGLQDFVATRGGERIALAGRTKVVEI